MALGLIVAFAFVAWLVVINRALRRRDRAGHWDKEGHGFPEHQKPGVQYRPLEVPPSPPFD